MSFFMNYILPEGFDFYSELKKTVEEETPQTNHSDEKVCLISGEPLEPLHIKMECGHSFNYIPLFKDLQSYKCTTNSGGYYTYSDYLYLKEHQIRCPYCRQVQENILPYLPDIEQHKVRGVNYPPSLSMGNNMCSYVFKSGKNKNRSCGKKCFRDMCHQHYKPFVSYENVEMTRDSLNKMNVSELKKLAKHNQLKKYSMLRKNEIINLLMSNK